MKQLMYPECGGVGNEKWKEPFKRQRIAQAKFNPRAIYHANETLEEFDYNCTENQPNEIINAVDNERHNFIAQFRFTFEYHGKSWMLI